MDRTLNDKLTTLVTTNVRSALEIDTHPYCIGGDTANISRLRFFVRNRTAGGFINIIDSELNFNLGEKR